MLIHMNLRKPVFTLLLCVLCAPHALAGDPPDLDAALSQYTARMRAEFATPRHTSSFAPSHSCRDLGPGMGSASSLALGWVHAKSRHSGRSRTSQYASAAFLIICSARRRLRAGSPPSTSIWPSPSLILSCFFSLNFGLGCAIALFFV